ncbi:hypothetical protein CERSUDRAFT_49511 [Gelatoporia subvermispora B]|uniref:Calcineurin-like phosphoesterase domain-containing protein n=1 Tax=Ceriporiopsis subvermispora (strain B) TaxID=914234 RepID=M2R0S1_CERS8|nr:hypothetical protein CERSUDRAFT_49511 [Gelatoporia subvermispora B]
MSSLFTATAAVYVSYDTHNPPSHPGSAWTRFICISDTHSRVFPVPLGDVLLHAGDLSSRGSLAQLQLTLDWIKSLPHPVKIFNLRVRLIAGNHDVGRFCQNIHRDMDAAQAAVRSKSLLDAGVYYIEHESIQITSASGRTWQIYGSPAAPRHSKGSFQYERKNGSVIYEGIPTSTEILLTHSPPHGIRDVTRKGVRAGCTALAQKMQSSDMVRCKLHVFGHIHEAHGAALTGDLLSPTGGRISVNAALHSGGRTPVIVDLKN